MDGKGGDAHECGGICSVELALQVIGGKWKPVILWRLRGEGSLRFGELRRLLPSVTQKMLTQQLRELEADGLVLRRVHAQVPPRVDYWLTELGRSVLPVLESLGNWGARYRDRASGAPGAGSPVSAGGSGAGADVF